MKFNEIDRLADHAVLPGLDEVNTRSRSTTVERLAYIAVAAGRRLYLAAGYPSRVQYCVGRLRMTKATAFKRIDIGRAARKHPAIFDALAEGRLNLTGVLQLAPHLDREIADALLAAAENKTNAEIDLLLAERFPRADVPTRVQVFGDVQPGDLLATGTDDAGAAQLAVRRVPMTTSGQVEAAREPRAKITPLSPQRFKLEFTVWQEAHDLLVEARALLGHRVPSGDVSEVFLRAMRVLVEKLKQQRFAETDRPRKGRGSKNARYIPSAVKRAVWERDGGRCTFVSDDGHRCESQSGLQFDHVIPVAKGGETTVANVRLLCRAHNQHAADRAFGKGFMDEKRQEAKRLAAELREKKAAAALARAQAKAAADAELEAASDVIPGLRLMGWRDADLRIAAAAVAAIPNAPTGERMLCAIRSLGHANRHRLVRVGSGGD